MGEAVSAQEVREEVRRVRERLRVLAPLKPKQTHKQRQNDHLSVASEDEHDEQATGLLDDPYALAFGQHEEVHAFRGLLLLVPRPLTRTLLSFFRSRTPSFVCRKDSLDILRCEGGGGKQRRSCESSERDKVIEREGWSHREGGRVREERG